MFRPSLLALLTVIFPFSSPLIEGDLSQSDPQAPALAAKSIASLTGGRDQPFLMYCPCESSNEHLTWGRTHDLSTV